MKSFILLAALLLSGFAYAGTCGGSSSSGGYSRSIYRANRGYVQKLSSRGWVNVFRYKKIYYVYRNGEQVGLTTCQYGRGRVYPTK